MQGFLAMGGYAAFVWPCYAIAALVMAGIAIQSVMDFRAQQRLVRELDQGKAARPRAPAREAGPDR